jgi:hypothetical protein
MKLSLKNRKCHNIFEPVVYSAQKHSRKAGSGRWAASNGSFQVILHNRSTTPCQLIGNAPICGAVGGLEWLLSGHLVQSLNGTLPIDRPRANLRGGGVWCVELSPRSIQVILQNRSTTPYQLIGRAPICGAVGSGALSFRRGQFRSSCTIAQRHPAN